MGQQQLNCKNNAKDGGKEITTNNANALQLMKDDHQPSDFSELPHKKESNTIRSDVQTYNPHHGGQAHARRKISDPRTAMLLQHQNILRVGDRPFRGAQKIGSKWCQKPGKSLSQIVEARYNTTMHFPQSQVVTLIQSLTYVLAYLQKNNCKHHDFYPTNIYYHQNRFKISSPLQVEASAYELTQRRQRFSFLSPELIAELIDQTPASQIPQNIMFKADLFAIGMTLLQFCTLEQSCECFDQQNYALVDKVIRTRLAKTAQLYSPNIADCIAQMLKYDVQERIDPQELAIAVFLNAGQEKVENDVPKGMRISRGGQPPKQPAAQPPLPQAQHLPIPPNSLPPRAKQPNPPHVQQKFVIVPGQNPQEAPLPMVVGPNNIVLPSPNYQYSYIGPNNQSLLSSGTLHNKLRVIQKIQETPQEQQQSEGIPSHLGSNPSQLRGEQKIVVHQNQPPPNNQQIQLLHQQIQRQRMQQPMPQPHLPPGQVPPGPMPQNVQKPSSPNILAPPPSSYRPQAPPPPQPPVSQQHFAPHPGNFPPGMQKSPPFSKPNSPPPPQPLSQNYLPSNAPFAKHPSPSSPPVIQNSPQKSNSNSNSGLSYEDRMLMMKPTYYEVHGKQVDSPPRGTQNYQNNISSTFQQKTSYDYTITHKQDYKNINLPQPDIYKANYEPKPMSYDKQIPSYQSSYKYSTPSDTYAPSKTTDLDQNGQTLEQRVDRILQISRSIK